MSEEVFIGWESNWYNSISSESFVDLIKEGSVIALDVQGDGDCGSVGLYNALNWVSKGGVLIRPGDVEVTDRDCVIVVPRENAVEVAHYAQAILDSNRKGCRNLYIELGMPLDHTVEP